jgi:hypothetical protein
MAARMKTDSCQCVFPGSARPAIRARTTPAPGKNRSLLRGGAEQHRNVSNIPECPNATELACHTCLTSLFIRTRVIHVYLVRQSICHEVFCGSVPGPAWHRERGRADRMKVPLWRSNLSLIFVARSCPSTQSSWPVTSSVRLLFTISRKEGRAGGSWRRKLTFPATQADMPFAGKLSAIARSILNAAMLMSTLCTVHRFYSTSRANRPESAPVFCSAHWNHWKGSH